MRGSSRRKNRNPCRTATPRSNRKAADLIDNAGALGDRSFSHAMQCLQVELILGKISKRGNRYLRVLFVQAAWSLRAPHFARSLWPSA